MNSYPLARHCAPLQPQARRLPAGAAAILMHDAAVGILLVACGIEETLNALLVVKDSGSQRALPPARSRKA